MPAKQRVWGVDGCPGGWFAVSNYGDLVLESQFRELLQTIDAGRLYIDMPIGLPDDERQLEKRARQLLVGRGSSIFSVPCRQAVYANSYESACDINAKSVGKRLSKQAWFLCNKIKQIDTELRQHPSLSRRVLESHPELAFHLLSPSPLKHSKKSSAGISERLRVLSHHESYARQWYRAAKSKYPRKLLALDDIVDAMILMVVGSSPKQRLVVRDQSRDGFCIPIRMIVPAEKLIC